jgi:hypothetical protein
MLSSLCGNVWCSAHTYIQIHIYTYMHIYMCVCVSALRLQLCLVHVLALFSDAAAAAAVASTRIKHWRVSPALCIFLNTPQLSAALRCCFYERSKHRHRTGSTSSGSKVHVTHNVSDILLCIRTWRLFATHTRMPLYSQEPSSTNLIICLDSVMTCVTPYVTVVYPILIRSCLH